MNFRKVGPVAFRGRRAAQGQIIPLFALFLTVLVAGTGLVIDTGGAWAQKRNQQRGADLAALAGATAEANGSLRTGIILAATDSAAANGFPASAVTVNIPPTSGAYAPGGSKYTPPDATGANSAADCSTAALTPCWIEVVISQPHQNSFVAILPGQQQWGVAARAVSVGGLANASLSGVTPIMFDQSAVETPPNNHLFCNIKKSTCPSPDDPVPANPNQFTWTEFCYKGDPHCNFDSNNGKRLIAGSLQLTLTLNMDLGPNNSGQQVDVCKALLAAYPNGGNIVVAISKPDPTDSKNALLVAIWVFAFDATTTDCNAGPIIGGTFVNKGILPLTIVAGGGKSVIGEFVASLVE
jgi:Flp pilus assembly protein TadG